VRIKRTLGTLALASTLVLAGCSDDGGDDADSDDNASETPAPTEDESETDEPEGDDEEIAEFLEEFEEGVESTTSSRMTMDMVVEGGTMQIQGDVDYTTDPANMAMRMSGGAFGEDEIELRIVDGIVYMNLGATSQDKFLELSLEQLGAQAGLGNLTDQLDPNAQLETFREGLTELEFIGDEEIDGVDAEHYFLVVETADVGSAPGTPEELELDLWLDDEHRVIQTETDLGALGTITAKMFDFGADVEIEKPAPSEIQQLPGA